MPGSFLSYISDFSTEAHIFKSLLVLEKRQPNFSSADCDMDIQMTCREKEINEKRGPSAKAEK